VSGESSPEQLTQMKASGFACMSKPVRPARLRSWLVDAAGPTFECPQADDIRRPPPEGVKKGRGGPSLSCEESR
jgi:hypothetical protein